MSFTHVLVDPKKYFHRAPDLIPKVIAINRSALTPRCQPKKKVINSEVIKTCKVKAIISESSQLVDLPLEFPICTK